MSVVYDTLHWKTSGDNEEWLRPGEDILTTFGCTAVTDEGLRMHCAAVLTDDRLCLSDTTSRLPFDQLEMGHFVKAHYYQDPALFVPSAGDKRLLISNVSLADTNALVAAASAFVPLTLEVSSTLDTDFSPDVYHSAQWKPIEKNKKRFGPRPPLNSVVTNTRTVLGVADHSFSPATAVTEEVEGLAIDCEVRVVDLPGRQRALVAGRDYKKGEVVWSEEPLLVWQAGEEVHICDEVYSDENRRIAHYFNFFKGHDLPGVTSDVPIPDSVPPDTKTPPAFLKRFAEVLQTNCFAYTPFEDEHRALFALASLVNHSCIPNLRYDTKDKRRDVRFRALEDIQAGEELTLSYSHELSFQRRSEEIYRGRRFLCECRLCLQADPARSVGCASGCRGYFLPVPTEFSQRSGSYTWNRCNACHASATNVDTHAEEWLATLAETHTTVDIADPPVFLIAALIFAATKLGCRHHAVFSIAEHIIAIAELDGISPEAYVWCARLVLNWSEVVLPGSLLTRPSILQALGNVVPKLQAHSAGLSPLVLLTLARYLAPALETLRGKTDPDTLGMATVASLSTTPIDALAGFDWWCMTDTVRRDAAVATLASSSEGFKEKVLERVAVLEDALATGKDAYDL